VAAFPVVFGDRDIALARASDDPPDEIVIDVGSDAVAVRSSGRHDFGQAAVKAGDVDAAALGTALTAARTSDEFAGRTDVVVAVKDGVLVRELIEVLDAAVASGVDTIGLADWVQPVPRGPEARLGRQSAVGDLDKAIIRRVMKQHVADFEGCLVEPGMKPGLAGVVSTEFFISPKGTVASAKAAGVDDKLAACVTGVLKSLAFPAPKGGGGVQVNYPLTFRPPDPDWKPAAP
jgi:hypothetical protein